MRYESTRDKKIKIHSAVAVMKGISDEGGLFVPETIPKFSSGEIQSFVGKSYVKIAQTILSKYFTDFTESELADCIQFAYSGDNKKSSGKFGSERITPVVKLDDGKNFAYLLELWHGPTCAFKDIALQLMPRLMTCAMKKIENQKETGFSDKEAVVLVATSGDTGKAALEGFMDVENTRILVFYPADGVSELQKLQMTTQAGKNVAAYGVYGNFDDAQTAVKEIFTDRTMKETLKNANKIFSSANSINWGRLSPQIVYYAAAYCELLEKGELQPGENINFVVPTGNFGNILSAYYAKKMGLPINKLICASNTNNILTDFINEGEYNCKREFFKTISPSMDILISSNLERLIYELSGRDNEYIKDIFGKLQSDKYYKVEPQMQEIMQKEFYGGYCTEQETRTEIKRVFEKYSYVLDPHTAVGSKVYEDYKAKTGDNTKTVIAATANPYKFPQSVVYAIKGSGNNEKQEQKTPFEECEQLREISNQPIPQAIESLRTAELRFGREILPSRMKEVILQELGIM